MRKTAVFLVAGAFLFLLAACGRGDENELPVFMVQLEPSVYVAPMPTPTPTPQPVATPQPTATPRPTPSPPPSPDPTPRLVQTPTPVPFVTPFPFRVPLAASQIIPAPCYEMYHYLQYQRGVRVATPRGLARIDPCPARRTDAMTQAGISEYGWQMAVDFLMDFPSLFTEMPKVGGDNWFGLDAGGRHTHYFIAWEYVAEGRYRQLVRHSTPPFYHMHMPGRVGFFDRYGNNLYDEIWVGGNNHYANYFKLLDFDGTGIPDIFVHFQQTLDGSYWGWYRIFRYVDGAFRWLEPVTYAQGRQYAQSRYSRSYRMFVAETGRLISALTCVFSHAPGYYHVMITDYRVEFHQLAWMDDGVENYEAWNAHHWINRGSIPGQGSYLIDCWLCNDPVIFGTDIRIAPFHFFDVLAEEMYRYLQYQRATK